MELLVIEERRKAVTFERVCRATGCYNRMEVTVWDGGGRVKEYCSDTCKKRASRKGKAYSRDSKVYQLHKEHEAVMREVRVLEAKIRDLMKQSDLVLTCLAVATREPQEGMWFEGGE